MIVARVGRLEDICCTRGAQAWPRPKSVNRGEMSSLPTPSDGETAATATKAPTACAISSTRCRCARRSTGQVHGRSPQECGRFRPGCRVRTILDQQGRGGSSVTTEPNRLHHQAEVACGRGSALAALMANATSSDATGGRAPGTAALNGNELGWRRSSARSPARCDYRKYSNNLERSADRPQLRPSGCRTSASSSRPARAARKRRRR